MDNQTIQAFMGVRVTCENEEAPFKAGARMVTKDLPL